MSDARNLSQRVAWALLVVTLAIVWISEFRGDRWETCAQPDRLVDMLAIPKTLTSEIRGAPREYTLLFEWVVGELERPGGDLDYQVMRSDQVMNHRLNWHLKLQRLYQPSSTWVEFVDIDGERLPIHWSKQPIEYGNEYLTARMDILGSEPVGVLLWDLLRTAPGQLVFGTIPITSYVVELAAKPEQEAVNRELATEWLEAVARRNRVACSS